MKTNVELEKLVEETSHTEFLLQKDVTIKYDFEKCKENLFKIVDAFIEAKYNMDFDIYGINMSSSNFSDIPRSPNMHSRYSSVDKSVEMVLDSEKDAIQLREDLNYIKSRLTPEEKIYWNISVMDRAPRTKVEELLDLSKYGVRPIEESCIIKATLILGISVLAKQSSSVKSFNKRITEIVNET